jgi:sodium/hydrogen antiporter
VLGLPWGVGIIVGAILAPTDPVLASDVQVEHPFDQNRLRFALTGEASLNDGTAFPFLMLGLGLLGLHDLGSGLWRWVTVDVLWATTAGLGVGGALGTAVGELVLYMRRTHREAVGLDDFLALGLIALAYGIAMACHASGFLAAKCQTSRKHRGEALPPVRGDGGVCCRAERPNAKLP